MTVEPLALSILKDSEATRRPVFFTADSSDVTFTSRIVSLRTDDVLLKNAVPPHLIRKVTEGNEFFMQVEMSRFVSQEISTDGLHIVFPLNSLKMLPETRVSQRFPFQSEERVVCRILNPYDGETLIEKPVMDMSATGLSLRTNHSSKLFEKGTKFQDIRILIDGQPYAACGGTVIYVRKLMDSNQKLRIQVGLQLDIENTSTDGP